MIARRWAMVAIVLVALVLVGRGGPAPQAAEMAQVDCTGGQCTYLPLIQVPVPPIRVVSSRLLNLAGAIDVVGEIINETSAAVDEGTITATFFDTNGQFVTSATKPLLLQRTGPNQRTPFDIYVPETPGVTDRVVSYALALQTHPAGSTDYRRLTVVSQTAQINAQGHLQVFGTVRNDTDKAASALGFAATFYDAAGAVVDATGLDLGKPLISGASTSYSVELTANNPSFDHFVVVIEGTLVEPPPVPNPNPPCNQNAPAPAEGAQAWMTVYSPSRFSQTTVCARHIVDGHVVQGVTMHAVAHYKTKDTDLGTVVAGADGVAHISFNIGGATAGYTVIVDVTIDGVKTRTSFTPQ